MNGLDPKVGMWVNVVALVLAAVAAGTVSFGDLSPQVQSVIKTVATDATVVITAFNAVFHAYSAPTPGPLVK